MFKNQIIEQLAKPSMNPYKDNREKYSKSTLLIFNYD